MNSYIAKTLFSGKVIGKDEEILYIGIPGGQNYDSQSNFASKKNFKAWYNGEYMIIKNWHDNEAIRTFDDYSGRGNYKLAYFTWKPIKQIKEEVVNVAVTMAQNIDKNLDEWEKLRLKLHK